MYSVTELYFCMKKVINESEDPWLDLGRSRAPETASCDVIISHRSTPTMMTFNSSSSVLL